MTLPPTTSPSPSDLIADLSRLMQQHPAYASFIKTARAAVLGTLSDQGEHGIILRAIEGGANTYEDLIQETGFSKTSLHRNLRQLQRAGLVRTDKEATRGNFRPRKLFFKA